jgi:hypothetical protein
MFVKKDRRTGDWYVFARRGRATGRATRLRRLDDYRMRHFVISRPDRDIGIMIVKHISFPKELVGKRIRLKVEVVDDDNIPS